MHKYRNAEVDPPAIMPTRMATHFESVYKCIFPIGKLHGTQWDSKYYKGLKKLLKPYKTPKKLT